MELAGLGVEGDVDLAEILKMAEQAEKMAAKKAEQIHCDTPCVTEFECGEPSMKSELKVLEFDSYSKEWAEFVLENRKNRTRQNIHDYDVVYGR